MADIENQLTNAVYSLTTGLPPETLASSLVSLINNAFSQSYASLGDHDMFPKRLCGTAQLYRELGEGWLFIWTLDGRAVGTATIRSIGRGWTRVPMWEDAHPEYIQKLDIPIDYILTERAKIILSQLKEGGCSMALYELSLVAVDPEFSRKGIGSAMMRDVEGFVRAIDQNVGGAEKTMLVIFVLEGMESESWYRKRGYEYVATRYKDSASWGCKLSGGFNILTMFKNLS
ncbi:hypothetical protein L211DRAFT_835977 [Terfezia boudieri ATCC MYA-4762]|uniref:N-acetyltransferase domain-containing protein n=1 Tax=Terfezia boudieri ATCC MYA-4762 TaxID=1051890 RepID=A0A3N4LSV6_9PEZI|nr:hypothetical protein L211DRAFT_835977 [Terfezia boudieri ATCC MYA-4762]